MTLHIDYHPFNFHFMEMIWAYPYYGGTDGASHTHVEAYATYNVRRHERPIILAAAYVPTYPSSSPTALPYGTGTSTEALSGPRRFPAYIHTSDPTPGENISAQHLSLIGTSGASLF